MQESALTVSHARELQRQLDEYIVENGISVEQQNVIRELLTQQIMMRGIKLKGLEAFTAMRELMIAAVREYNVSEAYVEEVLSQEMGAKRRARTEKFTDRLLDLHATGFLRGKTTAEETLLELADQRPNPRSEPLVARMDQPPAMLPPPQAPRPIVIRKAGLGDKIFRETYLLEE